MRTLLLIVILSLGATFPAFAQSLQINDAVIRVPVPPKYENADGNAKPLPSLYFKTKKIEPLEKAGEFDEGIFLYGASIRSRKDRSNAEVYEQLFAAVFNRVKHRVNGGKGTSATGDLNPKLIDRIFKNAGGKTAATLDLVANDPTQKSFVVLAGYELIGVVTIPIYVETSFVFVKDRLVFAHNVRVAVTGNSRTPSKAIKSEMRRTSKKLRNAIQRANR
ncbi:hypothetical protein [Amylibacter sp. IMCC11727]|uniref:hypothetical protein n=1 Tax=Amylibacter sp. IMCC11727 TaxID=3039851 RepID=UPI00244E3062|nr:hypothetical protein [Amylibacter sp. IMCC11727]WGI22264.1 hypothetical protein QBD29_02250 [Amylibacter sp. IMCC11727]